MTRKDVLGLFIIVLGTSITGILLLATCPIWLTLLLIRPSVASEIYTTMSERVARATVRTMMARSTR